MKLTCVLLVGLFALTCCATKQETVSKSKIGINLDYHKAVLRLAKFQCMRAYAVLEAFDMLPDNYTSMFTQEEYDEFMEWFKLTKQYKGYMRFKEQSKKAKSAEAIEGWRGEQPELDFESAKYAELLGAGIEPEFHTEVLRRGKIEMVRAQAVLEQLDSIMECLGFDPDSYASSFTQEEYDGFVDSYKLTIKYK